MIFGGSCRLLVPRHFHTKHGTEFLHILRRRHVAFVFSLAEWRLYVDCTAYSRQSRWLGIFNANHNQLMSKCNQDHNVGKKIFKMASLGLFGCSRIMPD